MGITVGVGLQGSGKSYYAVAEIWKHIKKMHHAELNGETYKYKKIYTNIEGFIPNKYVEHLKFAELENLWKWEHEQYLKFENITRPKDLPQIEFTIHKQKKKQTIQDFDPFEYEESEFHPHDNIEIISANDEKIFKAIQNNQSEDIESDYITFVRPIFEEHGFCDCLIVIDEAHNHFPKSISAALKRLASYHRHFDQDYILITQDTAQLPRYITNLTVFTFKATSPAIRLKSDLFTYKIYSGGYIGFRDNNKLETKRLKANPYVFSLYHSGSFKIQKSSMYKVLGTVFLMIALLIGGFKYYTSTLGDGQKTLKAQNTKPKPKAITNASAVPGTVPIQTKPKKEKEELERYEFVQVANKVLLLGKRVELSIFQSMLSKDDKFLFLTRQLDGTNKRAYMLTKETLIKLGVKKNEPKKQTVIHSDPFNFNSRPISPSGLQ